MKKINKLSVAVATVSALMFTGSAFAAGDVAGDALVNLPVEGSTSTSKSVDVWFLRIDEAVGYSIDIVGTKDTVGLPVTCDVLADNSIYDKKFIVSADSLSCGQETTKTKVGDGNSADTDLAYDLCKWTTPDLPDGDFAIAVAPIAQGMIAEGAVAPEARRGTACSKDDTAYTANSSLTTDDNRALSANTNYQRFTVKEAAGTTTAKPNTPEPALPAAGSSLVNGTLTFTDSSSDTQLATWYELWVWDKNNVRVTDIPDNPDFNHWYKNTVDSELTCTTTNAQGRRTCTIGGVGTSATITAAGVNDVFTWWVKGFNSVGVTVWSTGPGTFKK